MSLTTNRSEIGRHPGPPTLDDTAEESEIEDPYLFLKRPLVIPKSGPPPTGGGPGT
jgi:hypothetical protein